MCGAALSPAHAALNKTNVARQCYTALATLTVSEDFDVLPKDAALKTALYLRLAPEQTQECSSLMASFEQQMKFRPQVIEVLKAQGIEVSGFHLAPALMQGLIIKAIKILTLTLASGNSLENTAFNQFETEVKIENKTITAKAGALDREINSLIFGYLIYKLGGWNPNSFRYLNTATPSRYATFTQQALGVLPEALLCGLALRFTSKPEQKAYAFSAAYFASLVVDKIIMNKYVDWMRAKSLAELAELEKTLPAATVNDVNAIISGN